MGVRIPPGVPNGEVPELVNGAVLKTAEGVSLLGVRIPPSPPTLEHSQMVRQQTLTLCTEGSNPSAPAKRDG